MSAENVGKLVGALVGMLVGVVLVIIASKIANKDKKVRTEYDERQKVLRGEGYKCGFYAMFIYAAINTIVGISGATLPMEPAVLGFSYVFVGAIVDIGYCIFHDCYWGLNNNRSKWLVVMAIAGLLNLVAVIMAVKEGAFINEGMISTPGINLLCAILLLTLTVCVLIKSVIDKKEANE